MYVTYHTSLFFIYEGICAAHQGIGLTLRDFFNKYGGFGLMKL
jgi:hypothetical protein